ncbi:thiol reductant ABC exporter subunit CydD [Rossellomorea aquimaris]|uniref:Thiol reductant ABC exporter subunit CydD n=1 Tax=Rossellomorea aquimaris TaxID=189382 RepID=A0A5D4TYC0_9BACI|nr:thiol reductant ABC exporter subunit CydD [Rossellomorea aquimaris]TYS79999.1 thiol reductant ABC exporter subunit CydD [Rossellomorea aquimaris]TYS85385.1 thiol reductant ABC exporter subunit CydD [Rossellomorea aquimaris]
MKELNKLAKQQKSSMMTLYGTSLLMGGVVIGQAYLLVSIVNKMFIEGAGFQDIFPMLGALLLILVGRAALTYVNGRTGIRMASKVKSDLRKRLLNKWAKNPLQASIQGQSGQKVSTMMDAVDGLDGYYSQYVPQRIQTTIVPLILLITIFTEHIYTGLIMVITAPFIPLFMAIIGVMTKNKSEKQMDKLTAFSGRFLDTLQGLTTLKLLGRGKQQKEGIRSASLDFREATMEVLKTAFLSSLMLEFISMLSIGLIALEVGLRLVVFESISFFTAFFVLVLAPEFYLSLKELGQAFHTGRGSMGAAKKVMEELEEKDRPVHWGEKELESFGTPATMELRTVGFSYGDKGFVLQSISAVFPPGSQVAIVGHSGAGKTTLLHLLAGLLDPSEGDIVIDGYSRSEYRESDWFDQLSYISQNPYLFSGTISENIAVGGREGVTREEIEYVAEKAGISQMIAGLDKGFDTPIGEAGRGLSGGEKQRIAIARAFLKKPSIILFDEPTTGLDLKTEGILQASIQELSKDSTVITVAHRLHTIREADQILFLENGKLSGIGNHEELMKSSSRYHEMVTAQQGVNT